MVVVVVGGGGGGGGEDVRGTKKAREFCAVHHHARMHSKSSLVPIVTFTISSGFHSNRKRLAV